MPRQSISCFRSTGALPIPTRRCSAIVPATQPRPPRQRKTSLPALKEAHEWTLDFPFEEAAEDLRDTPRACHKAVFTDAPTYLQLATATDPPKVTKAPPPKLYKPDCKKHSKCHCTLFSKEVVGFFDVTKY